MKLSSKESLFANYYLGEAGFNATKAAKLAGYSEYTARQIGYENLTKPYIKEYIRSRSSEILDQLHITQERVLAELAKIAFSDVTEIFNEDWSLKSKEEICPSASGAIKSLKKSDFSVSVQMHDKIKALQILRDMVKDGDEHP
ncbi:terminase small subunit [Cyclobacterium jeungdonense]|uniref:Terminase small subunit n=1 Tax=Cyclobacterium jeungdonense TaxID=708087 RepID=A0ABT8CA37_9BACT|nr:terminase small subunit [Cyclobacterium jeungdonense]MDN3689664.1 terminase small subunit [Cyclobacterium jeungdonense]